MNSKKSKRKLKPVGRRREPGNRFNSPRTTEQFFALSRERQDLWKDVDQVVTEMRNGNSLRAASKKFGRDPRTIQRLARPALRRLRNGRWAAKSRDTLLRVVKLPDENGLIEVGLRDSRQSSIVGEYWNAVEKYRDSGAVSDLRRFEGKYVTDVNGDQFLLMTEPQELDNLASAGVLSFETLYAGAA
jgi:hypothetical protein